MDAQICCVRFIYRMSYLNGVLTGVGGWGASLELKCAQKLKVQRCRISDE